MSTDIKAPYQLRLATSYAQRLVFQNFIQAAYQREFRARIPHFLPLLLGLYRGDGQLVAACGLQFAGRERLYLEHYLDAPVEQLLASLTGCRTGREQLVEIGNLATSAPGNGRLMFAAICQLLYEHGLDWVVFTGTVKLRNSFHRLHLQPVTLAEARAERVGPDALHWGDYYRHHPSVMAGDLAHSRQVLTRNSLLLSLFEPMPTLLGNRKARAWQ